MDSALREIWARLIKMNLGGVLSDQINVLLVLLGVRNAARLDHIYDKKGKKALINLLKEIELVYKDIGVILLAEPVIYNKSKCNKESINIIASHDQQLDMEVHVYKAYADVLGYVGSCAPNDCWKVSLEYVRIISKTNVYTETQPNEQVFSFSCGDRHIRKAMQMLTDMVRDANSKMKTIDNTLSFGLSVYMILE